MRRDDFVDFFAVEPHQVSIHKRLENWALSCHNSGGAASSPMFRLYRPDNFERGEMAMPVDLKDASKIAKGVAMLPQSHRIAIHWNYITGGNPTKARQRLGVTAQGLMLLIRDGRQMLMNRNV